MSSSQNVEYINDELFLPKCSDSTIHNSSMQLYELRLSALPSFSLSKPQKDAGLFLDIPSTFSMRLSSSERQRKELFFECSTEICHEAITRVKTSTTPAHRSVPRIPTCIPQLSAVVSTQSTLAELEADASIHRVELSNGSAEGADPIMVREYVEHLPLENNTHTTPFSMYFFEMLLKEPALRERLAASWSKLQGTR